MRNPNRTTKGERRFVRRYNPYAARVLGAAEAARWYRRGILLDEAAGFDNILNDLKCGTVPLDLNDRVNTAIDGKRDRLERILGTVPGALTPPSANVNHYSGGPMRVVTEYIAPVGGIEPEPLGPSECGHYELADVVALHDCTIAPCGWTQPRAGADPRDWHDPNEAAALRAEAIERELDDDINPEE